jgi:hypothetical protein
MAPMRNRSIAYEVAVIGGGILYTLGVCFCIPSYRDRGRLARGTETPRQLRLNELAANGSPDNIHVCVSDFTLGQDHHIYQGDKGWVYVAIPAFSPDGVETGRPVIVKAFGVKGPDQLKAFYSKQRLTGLVDDDPSFDKDTLQKLQRSFPGKDLGKAVVIAEGIGFPDRGRTNAGLAAGTAMMFVGLVCVWGVIVHAKVAAGLQTELPGPEGGRGGPVPSGEC